MNYLKNNLLLLESLGENSDLMNKGLRLQFGGRVLAAINVWENSDLMNKGLRRMYLKIAHALHGRAKREFWLDE